MAEEAILRIVIVDEAGKDSSSYVPPVPAAQQQERPKDVPVIQSFQILHTAIEGLTADIVRTAISLRQLAPAIAKAPLAITYKPQSVPAVAPTQHVDTSSTPPNYYASLQDILQRVGTEYIQPEELQDKFAGTNLTAQEKQVLEMAVLGGKKYPDIADELGVHKSRITQVAQSIAGKAKLPISLAQMLKEQADENAKYITQEQEEAGAYIDFASEGPGKKVYTPKVSKEEEEAKKATVKWLKDAKKIKRDEAPEVSNAAKQAAEEIPVESYIEPEDDNELSEEDAALLRRIEAGKHIAEGGEAGDNIGRMTGNQKQVIPPEPIEAKPLPQGEISGNYKFIDYPSGYEPKHYADGTDPYEGLMDEERRDKQGAEALASIFDLADAIADMDALAQMPIDEPKHRAAGGRIDMSRGGGVPNMGHAESGADWHPAWLTDKEYVINAKSSARNREALQAANANPDIRLEAKHYALGSLPAMAQTILAATGPQSPKLAATAAASSLPAGVSTALSIAGGPIGQIAVMAIKVQKEFQQAMVGAVQGVGAFAQAIANPDANPSQVFKGIGDILSTVGDKTLNPLMVVAGETAKQFGVLMDAISATATRYGEYNVNIAAAEAMVEVKHTMGELRRSREAGPELARYLRAQGDLQQKVEDIKIKLLVKLLPLVTAIVNSMELAMTVGEGIATAVTIAASPMTAAVDALNRIAFAQEDANRPDAVDPTEAVLRDRVQIPNLPGV